jgi:uncharacterized repeat protein (TIGR02543 family)
MSTQSTIATTSLNTYKATFEGNSIQFCDADNIVDASQILTANTTNEPILLQRVAVGVQVQITAPALAFTTAVDDTTAYTAGCRSYPSAGGTVKNGDILFLSAVAAQGYTFAGWYNGTTLLASTAEAQITVESTATVPTTITYTAKFTVG